MSDENQETTKLKTIDEGLNNVIIKWIIEMGEYYANGQLIPCFKMLKSLFNVIEMHTFEKKTRIKYLIDQTDDALNKLGGRPLNKSMLIKLKTAELTFEVILDELKAEIPKAYSELGKWLQVVKQHEDFDKQLSEEMFNIGETFLPDKKAEIKEKMTMDELLDTMHPNAVHLTHSRLLIDDVKRRKKQGEE